MSIGPVSSERFYVWYDPDLSAKAVEDKPLDDPSLRVSETLSEVPVVLEEYSDIVNKVDVCPLRVSETLSGVLVVQERWFGKDLVMEIEGERVRFKHTGSSLTAEVEQALKHYYQLASGGDLNLPDENDRFLLAPLGSEGEVDSSELLRSALESLNSACIAARLQLALEINKREIWIGRGPIQWALRP